MDHEQRNGHAPQRWINPSKRLENATPIKPGGSTLASQLPAVRSTPPQSTEPPERWDDGDILSRAEDVFRSMAPDADNLAQLPGEVAELVRSWLPYFAGVLALGMLPAALGAGPAALITSVVAIFHKVAGPVMNTAQRANVIVRLNRWFRRAWNARHRPAEIKAANADFVDLLVSVALMLVGAKNESSGRGSRHERTTLPTTRPAGSEKSLPATTTRSLVIAQTHETVHNNILHVNGMLISPIAGGSQTLDEQASFSALSPSHDARDSEPDAEIRHLYKKIIDYFDNHAIDTNDANVYEEYMRESIYGSHDNIKSAEQAANAIWYIPELDWMAAELELRINGSIGLLGEHPGELRTPSKPSIERAKEALDRIREIQNKQRMTLGEYRKVISEHHVAFGYEQNRREYPLDRHKPFRPLLERRRPLSYRQINDMYAVGAGPVEMISTEFKYADGIKYDKRSYPRHDTAHYDLRPDMPSEAGAFLRHASNNIDFYTGFEQRRDLRPPSEQELLDLVWFDLSREGKDGFWPREINPVTFALVLADEKTVCAQILVRLSEAGHHSYKLANNRMPSLHEIKAAVKLIRDYVEDFMATAPTKQQKLLEFYREQATSIGGSPHVQPYWLIELETHLRKHARKPYWEILTPQDYQEGYRLFGDKLHGAWGEITPLEQRQIDQFLDLVNKYMVVSPS